MNKANIFDNELEALHEKVLHKKHRSPPCFSFRDKSHFVCELKIPPFHSLHSQMSVEVEVNLSLGIGRTFAQFLLYSTN